MRMQKGQFFIISAISVVFAVILLGSSYFYSMTPLLREQAGWSDIDIMVKGVETELDYISQGALDEQGVDEYLSNVSSYFASRGFSVDVDKAASPLDPKCKDYNITVTLPSCELFTFYSFTKCFEDAPGPYCHDMDPGAGVVCDGECGTNLNPATMCMAVADPWNPLIQVCQCRVPCADATPPFCSFGYCTNANQQCWQSGSGCACGTSGNTPVVCATYPECDAGDCASLGLPGWSCESQMGRCICVPGGVGPICTTIIDPDDCDTGTGCDAGESCIWNVASQRCGCATTPALPQNVCNTATDAVSCLQKTGCAGGLWIPCVWDGQGCGCIFCNGVQFQQCQNVRACNFNAFCQWNGGTNECECP